MLYREQKPYFTVRKVAQTYFTVRKVAQGRICTSYHVVRPVDSANRTYMWSLRVDDYELFSPPKCLTMSHHFVCARGTRSYVQMTKQYYYW